MAEKTVIYTYKAEPGFLLPVGVPAHDLTQQDIERMPLSARREVKALAEQGMFFTPVSKTAATKALNAAARDEADEAKAAAKEGDA